MFSYKFNQINIKGDDNFIDGWFYENSRRTQCRPRHYILYLNTLANIYISTFDCFYDRLLNWSPYAKRNGRQLNNIIKKTKCLPSTYYYLFVM